MLTGRRSWRWLRVLIEHLPAESATMTALRNATPEAELERLAERAEPERARWSQTEQLLASVVDELRRLKHIITLAHTDSKARKPKAPEPIRRPGVRQERKKTKPITERGAETLFRLINGGAA